MVSDPLAPFWVHTVQVQARTGEGPEGETFAAAVDLVCFAAAKARLIRGATGDMITSETTITAPAGASTIPVGSRITLPDGTATTVLRFARADGGGLATPDHVEIVCE